MNRFKTQKRRLLDKDDGMTSADFANLRSATPYLSLNFYFQGITIAINTHKYLAIVPVYAAARAERWITALCGSAEKNC